MLKTLPSLSTAQLAALIGITATQVARLVTAKIIPKAARGSFDGEAALRSAFAYYRTTARVTSTEMAEERIRLVAAQRKDIEDRTAQRSRNLISYEEHSATLFTVCGIYNTQLDGLGGRLANELAAESSPAVVRKRIFDETQRIRLAAAKEIEASAERPAPRRANGKAPAGHDGGDMG